LQADPFSPAIHGNIAMCDFLAGRCDAAIEQLRDELALHPDRALTEIDLGRVYIQKGDYQNGLAALRHARTLAGGDLMFEAVLAYGLARAGERAEAEAIFDRLVRASDTRRVPPYYLAVVSAGLGRNDEAFRWLEQVLSERHISALSLNVEPELSSLRSDPRFPDLRRRAGLE
jgi:cytochrome c-type biogenesis protein CcmH/NrfG